MILCVWIKPPHIILDYQNSEQMQSLCIIKIPQTATISLHIAAHVQQLQIAPSNKETTLNYHTLCGVSPMPCTFCKMTHYQRNVIDVHLIIPTIWLALLITFWYIYYIYIKIQAFVKSYSHISFFYFLNYTFQYLRPLVLYSLSNQLMPGAIHVNVKYIYIKTKY